jgi:hypothetical protein
MVIYRLNVRSILRLKIKRQNIYSYQWQNKLSQRYARKENSRLLKQWIIIINIRCKKKNTLIEVEMRVLSRVKMEFALRNLNCFFGIRKNFIFSIRLSKSAYSSFDNLSRFFIQFKSKTSYYISAYLWLILVRFIPKSSTHKK